MSLTRTGLKGQDVRRNFECSREGRMSLHVELEVRDTRSRGRGVFALGYGSIYNHSYSPNARYVKHFDRRTIDFIALWDIAAGEEIPTNYNGVPDSKKMVWFEVSE